MPIFDTSRIRRTGWTADTLAEELVTILEGANRGIAAPLVIRCEGDEPAIKIFMPDADLTEVPPIQVRSGTQVWAIPAWPSDHNPNPIAPLADPPSFTPVYHGAPFGQSLLGIETTTGATVPNPREEARLQLPLTLQGTVVSGAAGSYVVDVFLADPAAAVAYLRMNATDRSAGSALAPGDPVVVSLYFPADLNGQAVAYIA